MYDKIHYKLKKKKTKNNNNNNNKKRKCCSAVSWKHLQYSQWSGFTQWEKNMTTLTVTTSYPVNVYLKSLLDDPVK